MACDRIDNFEELLSQKMSPNKKIFIDSVSDLTQPGENYMSHVLKVDVTVKNLKNVEEETRMHFVVKIMKDAINEDLIILAKSLFEKEIAFYSEILPTLRLFQIEEGYGKYRDMFSDCFCFRKNLSGNTGEIDGDTVIVMENLKYKG